MQRRASENSVTVFIRLAKGREPAQTANLNTGTGISFGTCCIESLNGVYTYSSLSGLWELDTPIAALVKAAYPTLPACYVGQIVFEPAGTGTTGWNLQADEVSSGGVNPLLLHGESYHLSNHPLAEVISMPGQLEGSLTVLPLAIKALYFVVHSKCNTTLYTLRR
jgi:hypothetical protein